MRKLSIFDLSLRDLLLAGTLAASCFVHAESYLFVSYIEDIDQDLIPITATLTTLGLWGYLAATDHSTDWRYFLKITTTMVPLALLAAIPAHSVQSKFDNFWLTHYKDYWYSEPFAGDSSCLPVLYGDGSIPVSKKAYRF